MVCVVFEVFDDNVEMIKSCMLSVKSIITEYNIRSCTNEKTRDFINNFWVQYKIPLQTNLLHTTFLVTTNMIFFGKLNSKTGYIKCYYNNNKHEIFFEKRLIKKNVKKYPKIYSCYLLSKSCHPTKITNDNNNKEYVWYKRFEVWKNNFQNLDFETMFKSCLEIYNQRRTRIEPLYVLIEYFRLKSENLFAYYLLKLCMCIKFPSRDIYGIQPALYHYKRFFEASIVAFYVNSFKFGYKACEYLFSISDFVPSKILKNVDQNVIFYIPSFKNTATHKEIKWNQKPSEHFLLNPSLILDQNQQLLINIRVVNSNHKFEVFDKNKKKVVCSTENPLQTYNIQGSNDNYEIFETNKLPYKNGVCQGIEDIRLFKFQNEILFIATTQDGNINHINQMVLGNIKNSHVTLLQSPNFWKYEKNWLCFEHDKKLLAIYSVLPLIIYEINSSNGICELFYKRKFSYNREWRGSSCPILYKNWYYFIIHEVFPNRTYIHRVIKMSTDFKISLYSNMFRLQNNYNVEYVTGMAIKNNSVFISWGENDEKAFVSEISCLNFFNSKKFNLLK